MSKTAFSGLETRAAPALQGARHCYRVFPTLRPPRRQHPGETRASARRGSLGPRFRPGLWGKAGGRGPSSVPIQTRGCRVQRGPRAPGPRAGAGAPAVRHRECTHRPAAPPPRSPRPRAHRPRTARVSQPRRPLEDRPTQRGRGRLQARPPEIAAGPAQSAGSPPPAAPTLGALPGDPQLRAPAAAGRSGASEGRS